MKNDSLLSPANIAELALVSRPVVSNWRRRYDDFPDPVGGTDARPLFSRADIITWLTNRNHQVNTDDTVAAVWAAVNSLRGMLSSADTEILVLILFATHQYLPDLFEDIEDSGPEERSVLLERAEEILRQKYPVDARDALRFPMKELLDADAAARLSPIISAISSADTARAADYADELIARFSRSQGRIGGVSGSVGSRASRLLVALAENVDGTVYDPASGIAEALITIARKHTVAKLVGSDIDPGAVTVACLRALLSGINVSFSLGDVLAADPVPGLQADAVVVEPPFGFSTETPSAISDPRFSYGVPSRRGSELLWIQHALAHLAPGGRAYVLTSHIPLRGSRAEQQVRANLLSAGCVEAVVALPGGLPRHTMSPLVLWVLRNPDPAASTVLVIDASESEHPETEVPEWLRGEGAAIGAPSRVVDVADILADDSILTPARWVQAVDRNPADVKEEFAGALAAVERRLSDLSRSVLDSDNMTGLPAARVTTIGELIDNGIVELRRHPRPRTEANVVTAGHLRRQELPVGERTLVPLPEETAPGDVLVSTMNGTETMIDTEGGLVTTPGVECLRVTDRAVLLPEYLVHVLQGDWNERYRTGGTLSRIPIHDLEVPLIPVAEQQRITALLQQVRTLSREAARLIDETAKLTGAVLDTIRYDATISADDLS